MPSLRTSPLLYSPAVICPAHSGGYTAVILLCANILTLPLLLSHRKLSFYMFGSFLNIVGCCPTFLMHANLVFSIEVSR